MTESGAENEYMQVAGARILLPCDMPDDMIDFIVAKTKEVTLKGDVDKEGSAVAEKLKKKLDSKYSPHWHVVIGNGFGCHAVHEQHRFIFFYLNNRAFMFYKAGSG